MTAKWIRDVQKVYWEAGEWEDFLEVLDKVNNLLNMASYETDNELLHESIREETEDVTG